LASAFNPILSEAVGKTGETDLFVPVGDGVSHYNGVQYTQVEPAVFKEITTATSQGMAQINYEGVASVVLQSPVQTLDENSVVKKLGWVVVYHQHQDEAFAPANAQVRGALIVMVIVMILAIAAAIGLSLYLVRPITLLTQTAEAVAAGDLNSRAKVTSSDEIGTLASTFNSMTTQLQETLGGLEQRVAARTRDLEIVAEVGTATATILESKRLLQEVVDLTKERFNLYHSHIYLLDEKGENLVLTAGAGEPGRVMVTEGRSIPLNREQSLVARAARERKGVTVNDVTQAPDFLPNPLLPDTRSELAVPMVVGGNVIGVFDIQSDQVGRFTESDVNIQTTLAAQLATSIQNVRSFEQSKKQAELQSLVNMIGSRIQRTTSIEETLQTAIRELGTAIGASRVQAKIDTSNGDN
jgi:nitrate/nitrite-specific signal transduction histidine kinase